MIEISRPCKAGSKRGPDLGFIDDKAVDGVACRQAYTVSCELKLALTDLLMVHDLGSKMI